MVHCNKQNNLQLINLLNKSLILKAYIALEKTTILMVSTESLKCRVVHRGTLDRAECSSSKEGGLLLLDGGWTTKSPADGNKSLSLPKSSCSQEVVSSCLGKDLSAWRRSPISGTDYSGREHITVNDWFWIARLVMKHS